MYYLRKTQKIKKHKNFIFHDNIPRFGSESRNWLSCKDGTTHSENCKCMMYVKTYRRCNRSAIISEKCRNRSKVYSGKN